MASYGISPEETTIISFKKTFPERSGAPAIEAYGPKDPAILEAVAMNTSFPPGDMVLGGIRLRGSAGSDIDFAAPSGTVKFSAEGGGFASLGIYHSGEAAIGAMELDERLSFGLSALPTEQPLFLVMQWGYDLAASGRGAIALGPVPVEIGAEGKTHGKHIVIRRVSADTPARSALQSLADAWTIPALVHTASDMEPGSWIVTEVDGAIALRLAATYGYNFNWVREAQLAGLQGTIGLKVQAGLSAALGFEASGAYLLALGRESDTQTLRLRLFRQKRNGLSFALNAGVTAQASTGPFTKENFDELILAVLGLHHQQLIKDLQLVSDWAGGDAPLSGIFKQLGAPYVEQLIRKLADVPLGKEYEAARTRVSGFLKTWGELDQSLTTALWHLLPEGQESLNEVKTITDAIASANSAAGYLELLQKYLPNPDFLVSPLGQWLETLAGGELLCAAKSDDVFGRLRQTAQQVSALLNDAVAPNSVLRKLYQYVEQNLNLDHIQTVVDQASLDKLDVWVVAKIAAFADQTVANFDAVKQVQHAIALLLEKKDEFVNKAFDILQRKYQANFAFAYQASTTKEALLDVEFDFSQANPSQQLSDAVRGRFDDILLREVPGVVLHQGILSHQVTRNSHVELSLPYFKWQSNHLNASLARINSTQGLEPGAAGLRVEVDLQSEDTVTRLMNSGGSVSHLALSSAIHAVAGTGIDVFDDAALRFSYAFRKASTDITPAEFESQLGPGLRLYLGKVFDEGLVQQWTAQLKAAACGKPGHIGDVLYRLQLAYESRLLAGWLNAPQKRGDARYQTMSLAIQSSLKRLIPQCYFAGHTVYSNVYPAYVLAVYSSIPPACDRGDVYWEYRDKALRDAKVDLRETQRSLAAWLASLHAQAVAANSSNAHFYEPENQDNAGKYVKSGVGEILLMNLLHAENAVVQAATDAGIAMARFRQQMKAAAGGAGKVAEALEQFAAFGASVTKAFNEKLQDLFGGDEARAIGSAVYAEAARTLGDQPMQPAALAEVIVLAKQSGFDMKSFLTGTQPDRKQVLLNQAVVNS